MKNILAPAVVLGIIATLPQAAWASAADAHASTTGGAPNWLLLVAAGVVLAVIVSTSLLVENILKKTAIFLGLGAITIGGLLTAATLGYHPHEVNHILEEVYLLDYPKFIGIPLVTVLVASLGLFAIQAKGEEPVKLGWFMWLAGPFIGNFMTTWALVPIGLSLAYLLRKQYPNRWLFQLIAFCVFSMNMLALGTLLADPPQAFLALKRAAAGEPIGFFYPMERFWPYLLTTQALYGIVLKRCGVEFGSITELLRIRPESWGKLVYGLLLVACLAVGILELSKPQYGTYGITYLLGGVFGLGALSSLLFGHEERHHTVHWSVETASVFVAFFAVVTLIMLYAASTPVSDEAMTAIAVVETMSADNAAAFATAYPQFAAVEGAYMDRFNLFPTVTFGGASPIGNGPQIILFLVILVTLRFTTVKEVFVTWFDEALVYVPYLLVWLLVSMASITFLGEFPVILRLLTGLVAITVALVSLLTQYMLRMGLSWDGRETADVLSPANANAGFDRDDQPFAQAGK